MTEPNPNAGIGGHGYHSLYYGRRDWRFYRYILCLILNNSEPGPILDVGCGTGLMLEAAFRWGLDCVGIDGSVEALSIAIYRCPFLRVTQHVLSEPFPFPDKSFQTVNLNQVIEHLEPRTADSCLDECFRLMKPGAMLYVASPSRFNRREWDADPTHINLYSPSELTLLIKSHGFVNVTPLNSIFHLFGTSSVGLLAARLLYRLTKIERLCSSANCIAYKP